MSAAADITRNAKSNLAFALRILPQQKRQDMTVFYAYCRIMDDIADNEGLSVAHRAAALDQWQRGLENGFKDPDPLQRELVDLKQRHELSSHLLTAIIEGCRMDLTKTRYETWDELNDYIWKVASSVGLVSIQLFGCTAPESKNYAVALGQALQLTNILRDVGEDLSQRNRIYIPLQDLRQFSYSEEDLANHVRDERFQEMMNFQARRALNLYEEAAINLTSFDKAALRPARIMSHIYQELLEKMIKDRFRVFDRRYRVSNPRKALIFIRHSFS